jgi:hypothetical protein
MSTLTLGLVVILAVATALFYVAGDLYSHHGSPLGRDVCALSRELCDHPLWGAIATACMGAIYLVLRAFKL